MSSQKLLTIIMAVVGVISALFLFMIINTGDEAIKAGEASGTVNTFMYIAYAVLLLVLGIVVIFSFTNKLIQKTVGIIILLLPLALFFIDNNLIKKIFLSCLFLAWLIDLILDWPKSKKTLMTVGAFLAIVVISYAISSGTDLDLQPFIEKGENYTEATSKQVGAGLYAFYFLAILAIGSMLYGGVKKLFNK